MLIKIIHMTSGSLILLLFAVQCYFALVQHRMPKLLKIMMHIAYTVQILAGVILLFQLPIYPLWLLIKIGLFFGAVAASVIAFRPANLQTPSPIAIGVAALCYISIIILIVAKPWVNIYF